MLLLRELVGLTLLDPTLDGGTLSVHAVRTKKASVVPVFLRCARMVGHLKSVARRPAGQVRAELAAPTDR